MAKGAYIGTEKIITITNLLDYNTLSNNNGGYWGKWNLSGQTDYVNWGSGIYPPGGQRSGRFDKNITSELAEATYQLTVQNGSVKVNLNSSHLYYFSIYLYQPSIVGSFACYWPIQEPPVLSNFSLSQTNTWERHSIIFNRNSFSNGDYDVRFDFDNPVSNSALYFGNVALVDLTATFGAGFEPDKEWCDENINFLDSSSTLASETATITVNYSVARKVKKMYIGINNVAHKVTKGYIGIGGVAKIFFSQLPIEYQGTATPLTSPSDKLMGCSFENYAIFTGGLNNNGATNRTNAYNANLIQTTLTSLSSSLYLGASASNSGRAIFAGGTNSTISNEVTSYNKTLTRSISSLYFTSMQLAGATTSDDFVIFAGGYNNNYLNSANYFSNTGVKGYANILSQARSRLSGGDGNDYAMFLGGINSASTLATVDAYNKRISQSTIKSLSIARCDLASTSGGSFVLVGGGTTTGEDDGASNVVESYSNTLTMNILSSLTIPRYGLSANCLNNYYIFAGGYGNGNYQNIIDIYTPELTHSIINTDNLSQRRYYLSSAHAGNYILFAGGSSVESDTTNYFDIVDIYEYLNGGN